MGEKGNCILPLVDQATLTNHSYNSDDSDNSYNSDIFDNSDNSYNYDILYNSDNSYNHDIFIILMIFRISDYSDNYLCSRQHPLCVCLLQE